MPAPGMVTVSDKFEGFDHTHQTGVVSIAGPPFVKDTAGGAVLVGTKRIELDENGHFTVDLVPQDAPGLDKTLWTYTATIRIGDDTWSFPFMLTVATPVVTLRQLAPVDASTGLAVHVPAVLSINHVGPDPAGDVELDFATPGELAAEAAFARAAEAAAQTAADTALAALIGKVPIDRDVVDPVDHGAPRDGVASDRAVVNSLIAPGKHVVLQGGHYIFDGSLIGQNDATVELRQGARLSYTGPGVRTVADLGTTAGSPIINSVDAPNWVRGQIIESPALPPITRVWRVAGNTAFLTNAALVTGTGQAATVFTLFITSDGSAPLHRFQFIGSGQLDPGAAGVCYDLRSLQDCKVGGPEVVSGNAKMKALLCTADAVGPEWFPLVDVLVGDVIVPPGGAYNGHSYRCVTAGTTGLNAPAFPTGSAATVVDGTAVWVENGLISSGDPNWLGKRNFADSEISTVVAGPCADGITLCGVNNSSVVTLNVFPHLEFKDVRGKARRFVQWCDSNTFGWWRARGTADYATGTVYNDAPDPTQNVGVYDETTEHGAFDTFQTIPGRGTYWFADLILVKDSNAARSDTAAFTVNDQSGSGTPRYITHGYYDGLAGFVPSGALPDGTTITTVTDGSHVVLSNPAAFDVPAGKLAPNDTPYVFCVSSYIGRVGVRYGYMKGIEDDLLFQNPTAEGGVFVDLLPASTDLGRSLITEGRQPGADANHLEHWNKGVVEKGIPSAVEHLLTATPTTGPVDWVCPQGVFFADALLVAPGGGSGEGGGGSPINPGGPGGTGGPGQTVRRRYAVVPGQRYRLTPGAAGAGGTTAGLGGVAPTAGADGTNGGNTTFSRVNADGSLTTIGNARGGAAGQGGRPGDVALAPAAGAPGAGGRLGGGLTPPDVIVPGGGSGVPGGARGECGDLAALGASGGGGGFATATQGGGGGQGSTDGNTPGTAGVTGAALTADGLAGTQAAATAYGCSGGGGGAGAINGNGGNGANGIGGYAALGWVA